MLLPRRKVVPVLSQYCPSIVPVLSHFDLNTMSSLKQIDSSTIDGNVELYTLSTVVFWRHKCQLSQVSTVTSVNLVFVSDKIVNNSVNLRIKWLSYSKISAILCVLLLSVLTLFYLIMEIMSTNVRKFRFSCYIWPSCIIDPYLCCHLLYLIIYLVCSNIDVSVFCLFLKFVMRFRASGSIQA